MIDRQPDAVRAAGECGKYILARLEQAMGQHGSATLAVSGGSSPRPMFEMFARTKFPWDRVQLYWVDERGVPPDHPQSNFKMANETWLAPAGFPQKNIHRIQAELPAEEAARRYIDEVRAVPEFDVIHQGMGPDGHTASLFPGEPMIEDRRGVAAALWVEKMKQWRITLLPAVLLAARHTAMLVTGEDKAEALKEVLGGAYEPLKYPTQIIARDKPKGRDLAWFLDEAAARLSR